MSILLGQNTYLTKSVPRARQILIHLIFTSVIFSYRWGNRVREQLGNLLDITQLGSNAAGQLAPGLSYASMGKAVSEKPWSWILAALDPNSASASTSLIRPLNAAKRADQPSCPTRLFGLVKCGKNRAVDPMPGTGLCSINTSCRHL